MPHIKTAEDGSTSANLHGEIVAIFRTERIILAGIKNKAQERRMVDQGIVNHAFKSIIKGEEMEGEVSVLKNL